MKSIQTLQEQNNQLADLVIKLRQENKYLKEENETLLNALIDLENDYDKLKDTVHELDDENEILKEMIQEER